MKSAIFYHAGCPICVDAESQFVTALDPKQYSVKVVHLAEEKDQLEAAKSAGVQSVPALVVEGQPFHINFGAAIADLA